MFKPMIKALPSFDDLDPTKRRWRMTLPQVETFKWLFMRLSAEHSQEEPTCTVAESAWLRLLLVNGHRWAMGTFSSPVAPEAVRPDILKLWQMIQDCVGRPSDFKERIHEFPNYDSLRQAFANAFGCSPSQMALRTRIQSSGDAKRLTSIWRFTIGYWWFVIGAW